MLHMTSTLTLGILVLGISASLQGMLPRPLSGKRLAPLPEDYFTPPWNKQQLISGGKRTQGYGPSRDTSRLNPLNADLFKERNQQTITRQEQQIVGALQTKIEYFLAYIETIAIHSVDIELAAYHHLNVRITIEIPAERSHRGMLYQDKMKKEINTSLQELVAAFLDNLETRQVNPHEDAYKARVWISVRN